MNLYGDKRDSELKLRIGTGDEFTYKEIEQLTVDNLLEDFDLFQVSSDLDNELYVYYYAGSYYLITSSNRIVPVDVELLRGRRFQVASKSITNNLQHYLQLYGSKALNDLSEQELIKVIMGTAYKEAKHIELTDLLDEVER